VSSEGDGNLSVELESKDAGARSVNIAFSAHKKKSEGREPLDAGDRLAQVAQATGGDSFTIEQLEALKSKLLELQPANRESRVTHHARNSIALAFLLPLLMAAEYFLRRRYVSG
jgi:hypothetical protein